ncbi:MAG TPA: LptA/OstA family protein, partial [Nitrospirota bacterium]
MRFSAFILIAGLLFTGLTAGAPQHVYGQTVPKKIPVSVIADKLDYDRTTDVYIAVGHVKIEQEGVRLEADKVVMDNKTGEAMAEGKVYLQDGADVIRAEKLRVNLSTRDGV